MTTPTQKIQMQKTRYKGAKASLVPGLHHQIEKRAYEIWLSNGCNHGYDIANWLQAESEMLAHHQKNPKQTL